MSTRGFRHNAFVYESTSDYVDRGVAFLTEGLDTGEAAILAGTRDRMAAMRDGLGEAATRVTFTDVGPLYTRPARTVAAYHRMLTERLRSAPAARILADVQYGPTVAEWDEWSTYEAISNHAYAHLPAWVVCTYSAAELPERMLEAVWRTHTSVLDGDWRQSPHFEDPARIVRELTPQPRTLLGLRALSPGEDLERFRERLGEAMRAEQVPRERALDLLVAATEVARNAWQHGGGPTELRTGTVDGRFVCEIHDDGPGFDDPLAGYAAPRPGQRRGLGLWVARQLSWRLELPAAERGCSVRLWL